MKLFFKDTWMLIRETAQKLQEHDPVVYAAAIAFFTVFSLPSVLIIIAQTLGTILDEELVRNQLADQVSGLIGAASTEEVIKIIQNRGWNTSNLFVNILSIIFLLISATVIFGFVQKALDTIWGVKPKPKKGVIKFLRDRLLSFSLIVILGFLLLVSLIIDALTSIFRDFLNSVFINEFTVYIIQVASGIASLMIVSLIFALIFKFLPDAKVRWKDVSVGALVTGILFTIGKFLIGLLLANTRVASTYGAAGSLAGILIWVFYSSLLLLVGAMFTRVYAAKLGERITPKKHSVRVVTKEVEMGD
ncbi:YihY/virulence factor BrkB family protein [Tunicatimonas pelagia]|uniref:YihY/virulence factor BrkB family protein n=1 Tax=Tunicatimonas pelagia TaxID=931531 RepID=UPI0026651213|nr:YihY/virulence factor BrkB family protein [Tunicatimonas pelagia]WKN41053.1 YihY/virulence factor BrkB family protein [Tunicatimonas pelagia]